MNFDFDSPTRRRLGYRVIDVVDDYFSSLPDRPVQPALERRIYRAHAGSIPVKGTDPESVIDELLHELVDEGFHIPSANYLGMMNPTPTYMAFLADSFVASLNPQLANVARSQLASRIEAETVRWIGELVGWPVAFGGTFTTGGNEANFSALAMALVRQFPRLVEEGLNNIGCQPVLYASAEAHHSLDKSAGLLGIGRKALRRIPVNGNLQIDIDKLQHAIRADLAAGHRPFCVVATAGTTGSGAIDPIPAISEICRQYNLWLHVDGAYGAALLFSRDHRALLRGIEHADSLTFDPHKWLAMPFSAGMILTRHPDVLDQTFSVSCPYLQQDHSRTLPDNMNISAQWSRRMNSLKLWLTLRVHGTEAYDRLIEKQMSLARDFANWVTNSAEFELAAPQVLPILNLRVKSATDSQQIEALHAAIVEEVNASGRRWISTARVNGAVVIRTMIISYLTEKRHLEDLQLALREAVAKPAMSTAA